MIEIHNDITTDNFYFLLNAALSNTDGEEDIHVFGDFVVHLNESESSHLEDIFQSAHSLIVDGYCDFSNSSIRKLPDVIRCYSLDLSSTLVSDLPRFLNVHDLYILNTNVLYIPRESLIDKITVENWNIANDMAYHNPYVHDKFIAWY